MFLHCLMESNFPLPSRWKFSAAAVKFPLIRQMTSALSRSLLRRDTFMEVGLCKAHYMLSRSLWKCCRNFPFPICWATCHHPLCCPELFFFFLSFLICERSHSVVKQKPLVSIGLSNTSLPYDITQTWLRRQSCGSQMERFSVCTRAVRSDDFTRAVSK